MKIKQAFVSILSFATASISIALPAFAYPATLTANNSHSEINVRSAPTTESHSLHYGLVGDRIEVIDTSQGDDGYIWHYVRFNNSRAEGWIRGDLVQSNNVHSSSIQDWGLQDHQIELQQDFSQQFMNLDIDQAMQWLRRQGFAPSDNGNGQVYFSAAQDVFEVTLNYNLRDYKVDSIVVRPAEAE